MSELRDEEVVLRKYLLADLDEIEQDLIEERLICDESFAEDLSQAESHLVDDYVFESLSPSDREKFEHNFILTDERRKNLLLAQALDVYLDPVTTPAVDAVEHPQTPKWWKRVLLWLGEHKAWVTVSAAAVILLIFVTPKAVKWLKPNEITSLQARRAQIERQVAEFNRRPFSTQSLTLPTKELSLQPSLLRGGGEIEQVKLNEEVKLLNLKLALPSAQYINYGALVRTADGTELFSIDELVREENGGNAIILLRIPPELLSTDDYQIDLKGIAADGSKMNAALYNLRVIKSTARP